MIKHKIIEKNIFLMGVLIFGAIIWGGIVQITPLISDDSITKPSKGVKPYTALQLAGSNIYVREGCYNCHSQMIRPFRWETERYGPVSVAGESVYDRPFQWGSKRTGPDLARVGGLYNDEWHREHLINPQSKSDKSNMPGFPWLAEDDVDIELTYKSMKTLKFLGHPYTDEQIEASKEALKGKKEIDALIAYLQNLGITRQRAK